MREEEPLSLRSLLLPSSFRPFRAVFGLSSPVHARTRKKTHTRIGTHIRQTGRTLAQQPLHLHTSHLRFPHAHQSTAVVRQTERILAREAEEGVGRGGGGQEAA